MSTSQTGLLTAQNFPELWLICSALLQKLSTAPCRETGYPEGPPTLSHQHRGTDWLPVCPPLSRHFGYLFSAMAEGTHTAWARGLCAPGAWLILPLVTASLLLAGKLIPAPALSLYLYSPRVAVVLGGDAQVSVAFLRFLGL